MSQNSQDRFNRLFPHRVPPSNVSTGLSIAERELLEYDERRQPALKPQAIEAPEEEDDYVLSQASTRSSQKRSTINQAQRGSIPGTNPNAAAFVPFGISKGGLSATTLDQDDDDYHVEPSSSNTSLIGRFCLFNLVVRFPYKYMQDPDSAVSREFFAAEKVYERNWDMHYLRDPASSKLLTFVPIKQVEQLTADINTKFRLKTRVPPYPFQISFYEGTPSPTRLGTVNCKQDMVNLLDNVPSAFDDDDDGELPATATKAQQEDYAIWQEKLERAVEAQKNKKSTSRNKELKRKMRIASDIKALSRTQQYLGLRTEDATAVGTELDTSNPVPYPFRDEPVFVSVDVESWESDHSLITEIGITTLDTRDLIDLEPQKWNSKIRSRHFRIKGREHLVNHRFVNGHPEHFQFGTSEFVPIDDAARAVDSCFTYPFSAGFECQGPERDENGMLLQRLPNPPAHDSSLANEKRNVILVGHGIDGDIHYLANLGCTVVTESFQFFETLDTTILYRSYKGGINTTGLATVCQDLGIHAFFLHNAGNDARYTLEALVKIALVANPQEAVQKVVQQMPPTLMEQAQKEEESISFEEQNKRYLEKAGAVENERIDHTDW